MKKSGSFRKVLSRSGKWLLCCSYMSNTYIRPNASNNRPEICYFIPSGICGS